MKSETAYYLFLFFLSLERLGELFLSKKNARALFQQGAIEVGKAHYRIMALLHTLFLLGCFTEVHFLSRPFSNQTGWLCFGLAIAAQGLRYWAIYTLGVRWNTRVIVLRGANPITGGPYRFFRHPNYVAVALEMAVVPMIHGAYLTAIFFSIANALLLAFRIHVEEEALGGERYRKAFQKAT